MGAVSQAYQFTATIEALERYSGRKFTNTQDIRIAIERQKYVTIPIPTTRTDIDEEVENILLGKEIDAYAKRIQQYRQNKVKIYSVDLGQFTEAMKDCLEGE